MEPKSLTLPKRERSTIFTVRLELQYLVARG